MDVVRRAVFSLVMMGLLSALPLQSASAPVTSLADGRKGKVEFQTLTLGPDEFWKGVKIGKEATISGELSLPSGDGPVPAIVMSHGVGGITGAEETWVRELRSMGYAIFLVDSFTGRGIKQFPSPSELSFAGQVYDLYQARILLGTHPRIDQQRVALMGLSRGGGVVALAAMTPSLKAQLADGPDFCAYFLIYPGINPSFDYGTLANRPIRIFTGTADEIAAIITIRAFTEKQRAAGADIKLFEYEGAHHAFDNSEIRKPVVVKGGRVPFTVAYHPDAHARMKQDMKEALADVFNKAAAKGTK